MWQGVTIHIQAMPVDGNSFCVIFDLVEDVDLQLVAWSGLDDGARELAYHFLG